MYVNLCIFGRFIERPLCRPGQARACGQILAAREQHPKEQGETHTEQNYNQFLWLYYFIPRTFRAGFFFFSCFAMFWSGSLKPNRPILWTKCEMLEIGTGNKNAKPHSQNRARMAMRTSPPWGVIGQRNRGQSMNWVTLSLTLHTRMCVMLDCAEIIVGICLSNVCGFWNRKV